MPYAKNSQKVATFKALPLDEQKAAVAKYVRSRCVIVGSCWLWLGGLNQDGYGYSAWIKMRLGSWFVHRASAWASLPESIEGKNVCHDCDTPRCANPEHFFIGTQLDNIADMVAKGRASRRPGELSAVAVLSEADVLHIRHLYDTGTPMRLLTKMFSASCGVSRHCIACVAKEADVEAHPMKTRKTISGHAATVWLAHTKEGV